MATIVQTQEGFAQVEYRLTLKPKKYLSFDEQRVSFVDAVIRDDVYGLGSADHTFRTSDPDFLATLKSAMADANPKLRFRLGYGTASNTYWLPWQEHIICTNYAKFEGLTNAAGHLIILHSENTFTRMRRPNRVLTRKGKISDMAAAIAQGGGMESVVEATDGDFLMVQNFTDDIRFLMTRLLPRAVNKNGVGGYLCFIRDNVLHFHTLDYQTSVKQIDYYGVTGSDFEASDLSQSPDLWDSGIAGVSLIAYDPYSGESKEVDSDPAKAIKLADGIYQFGNVENGSWNVPYHLGSNPVVELNALAQSMYQKSRRRAFRSTMTLQKLISIRHGDLLNVVLSQQSAKSSDCAGYYLVAGTSHTVKKGQAISIYTLERGETQPQRGAATVRDSRNQLTPVTQAPGQSPNILAAQSSELTKGAGNTASASTFTVVADAQTGKTR